MGCSGSKSDKEESDELNAPENKEEASPDRRLYQLKEIVEPDTPNTGTTLTVRSVDNLSEKENSKNLLNDALQDPVVQAQSSSSASRKSDNSSSNDSISVEEDKSTAILPGAIAPETMNLLEHKIIDDEKNDCNPIFDADEDIEHYNFKNTTEKLVKENEQLVEESKEITDETETSRKDKADNDSSPSSCSDSSDGESSSKFHSSMEDLVTKDTIKRKPTDFLTSTQIATKTNQEFNESK